MWDNPWEILKNPDHNPHPPLTINLTILMIIFDRIDGYLTHSHPAIITLHHSLSDYITTLVLTYYVGGSLQCITTIAWSSEVSWFSLYKIVIGNISSSLTPSNPGSGRGWLSRGGGNRNGAHMQKIGSKSQKLNEILRFENVAKLRFCLDWTHKNSCNSHNFWDRGLIFWI